MNAHVTPPFLSSFDIRDAVARKFGVSVEAITGSLQRGNAGAARQEVAYRVWTECLNLSLKQVALLIGRRDHAAAIHCIMGGARARGLNPARVSDLREPTGEDLDWTKLAYAVAGFRQSAGLPLEAAARRAGVSRAVWRKGETGKALGAGAVLRLCRLADIDPMTLIPSPQGRPSGTAVTHETPVKHRPAGAHDCARSR